MTSPRQEHPTMLRHCTLRHPVGFSLIVLLFLGVLANTATAQETASPDGLTQFVYPLNGASSADEIFVLYGRSCGRPRPDPHRPATVTREDDQITVDIHLVPDEVEVCFSVPRPDDLVAIPLGQFDKGQYYVTRRLHIRGADSDAVLSVHTGGTSILVGDTPNPAISGTWFDPEAEGSGLFINLVPTLPGDSEPQVMMFVLTHDAQGTPAWYGALGRFEDAVLEVELDLGADDASVSARFTYLGCGSGRLQLDTADELRFPDGGDALVDQLTRTAGLPGCLPPATRPHWMD